MSRPGSKSLCSRSAAEASTTLTSPTSSIPLPLLLGPHICLQRFSQAHTQACVPIRRVFDSPIKTRGVEFSLTKGASHDSSVRPIARIRPAAKALVYGLASLKTRFKGMPVLDRRLSQTPAQQDNFVVDAAGKIEETGIEILHLHTDGIDLRHGLPHARRVALHFRTLLGDLADRSE